MPVTRALAALLQTQRQSQKTEIDDISALKALRSRDSLRPSVTRNVSSPGVLQTHAKAQPQNAIIALVCTSSGSKPSSSSSSSVSSRSSGSSRSGRLSNRAASWSRSSASSRRSILGSSDFGDSSGDENDEDRIPRRLGGCSHSSQTSLDPDDNNKENVAPFRCTSEDVLEVEARHLQEENAVRRTIRSRRTSLMERPGFSTPSASPRRLSRSSTSSDLSFTSAALTTPRTPSRRLARAQSDLMLPSSSSPAGPSSSRAVMPSTPTRQSRPSLSASGRKRSRLDAGLEVDETDSLPATPLSRLRLQTPSTNTGTKPCNLFQTSPSSSALTLDEDMDSYFAAHSSQVSTQSSLFDTLSVADTASTPISSCCSSDREDSPSTTLEKLPAPVMERYSSIYAHARALLRYAAGVDPAETESGLTITGTGTSELHVKVVGRESERLAIQLFLQQRLGIFPHAPVQASDKGIELDGDVDSACLYVCGLPGTGKTALVRSVLNSLPAATSSSSPVPPRVAFVNCMTLSNPRLVFGKVLRALGSNAADGQPDSVAESALASLIRDGRQRILIVLDEMDHLLHSRAHQNILYRLFSWASSSASGATGGPTCSLIGIANSLDLTERFVPLLASKGASPALLHFRPFEATEIVTVIKDRLSGLRECYDDATRLDTVASSNDVAAEPLPLFTPTAVELLAKRIAGATGDLRKALDAARLAVEMVESEQRRAALAKLAAQEAREASEAKLAEAADEKAEAEPVSSQPAGDDVAAAAATARSNLLSHLTRATAPRATPSHVLKILSSVLGSPNLSKIRNLGVQPKLVLLAILVALARAEQGLAVLGTSGAKFSSSGVTEAGGLRIFDVESTYKALLKQDGEFSPLEGGELLGVFDVLEVNGVVRLSSEVDSVSSSSSSSSRNSVATLSNGVSPSGKRAAKKQLLASSRIVYLAMSHEDIQKGISTAAPCTVGSAASASTGPTTGKVVAETIARIYTREKDRAVKAQTYNSIIQENTRIRMEELGGGRMAIASGDL